MTQRTPWHQRKYMGVDLGVIARTMSMIAGAQNAWVAAWQENRRRERAEKSARRHTSYHRAGLNGLQAMERRRRQIAAGQITEANGLVR